MEWDAWLIKAIPFHNVWKVFKGFPGLPFPHILITTMTCFLYLVMCFKWNSTQKNSLGRWHDTLGISHWIFTEKNFRTFHIKSIFNHINVLFKQSICWQGGMELTQIYISLIIIELIHICSRWASSTMLPKHSMCWNDLIPIQSTGRENEVPVLVYSS